MDTINVNVAVSGSGGIAEYAIPVESNEGAVEIAAKYMLLNGCGWREISITDENGRTSTTLIKTT